MKVFKFIIFLIIIKDCIFLTGKEAIAQVKYDISISPLSIPGNSTKDYVVRGSTKKNYVIVGSGYHGTITLDNVNISLSNVFSPISIKGQDNCSNLTPVTVVNIILKGRNELIYSGTKGGAAFHVEQGAQINISAIDPEDNTSGALNAEVLRTEGGAGIGALCFKPEAMSTAKVTGTCMSPAKTAGGNIVISSGTIVAQGGHGAGIGGGFRTYYDGMIVIYGGNVTATCLRHAAGIGSGCPNGHGVEECYTPNSAIIVLPPSQISAAGRDTTYQLVSSLALAGANNIVYIGDTSKPLQIVHTEDFKPDADIYVDLSQNPSITEVINAIIPFDKLNINRVKFGTTNESGIFQFNGILQDSIAFFTDALSSTPETFGQPYYPENVILQNSDTIILSLFEIKISFYIYPSIELDGGYTSEEAKDHACRVKMIYSDNIPMYDAVFDLANGLKSDFDTINFFDDDRISTILPPDTLSKGDTIFLVIPLKEGRPMGEYKDILRIIGSWKGKSTGYIRHLVDQEVVYSIYAEICEGEGYFFKHTYLTKSGVYIDSLVTIHGADSIVSLFLEVNPVYEFKENRTICEDELPYHYRDTVFEVGSTSGNYIFKGKTISGCDSIVDLSLTVNQPFFLNRSLAIFDSELPYVYIDTIFEKGTKTGEYVLKRTSSNGCDSVVTLNLRIKETFGIQLKPIAQICSGDHDFILEYDIDYGYVEFFSVIFDDKATDAGFVDIIDQSAESDIIINVPQEIFPDNYWATIFFDNNEFIQDIPFQFSISYPSSIILQKWNDVLVLLNSDYNGGYEFSNFQWYKNGQEISGATKSYLYIKDGNKLDINASYNVQMTRITDSVTLFTCPVKPVLQSEITIYPIVLPFQEEKIITIKLENKGHAAVWNMYGQKINDQELHEGENQVVAPYYSGIYLLRVTDEIKNSKDQLIIVK